ncbi:HAMP domain-containing histidine kinase [Bacillus sp. ISL-8]|nr:HAMP domain-containing histidine kinase [Bacillus sp. ISL-8]
MRKIFEPIIWMNQIFKKMMDKTVSYLEKSIRIQLIATFTFCTVLGVLVGWSSSSFFEDANKISIIDYASGMEAIDGQTQWLVGSITEEGKEINIQELLDQSNHQNQLKILIIDENGKVVYKTKGAPEEQINLHETMRNVMDFKMDQVRYVEAQNLIQDGTEQKRKEFTTFYPVTVNTKNMYIIASGIPQGNVKYIVNDSSPFPSLLGFITFILSFFYITKRKMNQIEAMAEGVREFSKGNLQYKIKQAGQDEIGLLTSNINQMAEKLLANIEKEKQIEKQKSELITNVSHDLRTPLTSIMGYLRLLGDAKYENKEQHDEYIKIAFSKSEQLKMLIEDLFEYTKLTDENMTLDSQEVCMNELLDQLIEELVPQAEEHNLSFVKEFQEDRIYAVVDSEKMVRVFENLLINAIKYSIDKAEIRVLLQREEQHIKISIANHSEEFTKKELENLFERFYKKDHSRSRAVEGSGLGLAIAKSIVELHKGEIRAEYENGVIQFIILLPI